MQLDRKEFNLSIIKSIIEKAIFLTQENIKISSDKKTIKHFWKSLLFDNKVIWLKKGPDGTFDVSLRSFDVSKICKLIGKHTLHELSKIIDKNRTQAYRGSMVL